MPDTIERTDEKLFFESIFEEQEKCQLNHDLIGLPCSILVVAVGKSCAIEVKLCEVARLFCLAYMDAGLPCVLGCGRPARDCWSFESI